MFLEGRVVEEDVPVDIVGSLLAWLYFLLRYEMQHEIDELNTKMRTAHASIKHK